MALGIARFFYILQPAQVSKTFIFCHIIKNAALKNTKTIVVTRGRKIVDQASQRLIRERVEHGVLMSKHWNYRPYLPTQVCSIDTLRSRNLLPPADLIIIDEAHLAVSTDYKEFLSNYPNAFIIGCTATPYVNHSMRHLADTIVQPISMRELVNHGYLVPLRYFAPSTPDLKGVTVVNGEYRSPELEQKMNPLTGNIVTHWKKMAENRPTICFAVSVAHSVQLCESFLSSDIRAEHCDAKTSDREREKIFKRLESGETKIVCNVGILTTGVDLPYLSCLILARPTRSYALHIQMLGRSTRTFPGKKDAIILDHAGNTVRHGYIDQEVPVDLNGSIPRINSDIHICDICFMAYEGKFCPACGPKENESRERIVTTVEGELKEVARQEDPILEFIFQGKKIAKNRGYRPNWIWYQTINKFGLDSCAMYLPSYFLRFYEKNKTQ